MKSVKQTKIFKACSLTLASIFIVGSFAGCGKKAEEPTTTVPTTIPTTTEAPEILNPLTGEKGYDKALLKNRPVIISVENHPDARPQWGLCSSDIVMEMVAEGGITRMLLMYADKSRVPEKVGPVRSARHYFVELVSGFDAIFVHCGGSPYAYEKFNQGYSSDHIDHMAVNSCFTRDKSRNVAYEHTLYTTGSELVTTIKDTDIRTTLNDGYNKPFKFNKKAVKLSENACNSCTVSFSSAFTYTYKYDADKKLYFSNINGNPFCDSDGNQQNFTNLLIIYTNITDLNDAKNRVTFDLSEGHGIYVSRGTYKNITWEKGDTESMLKFFDENGKELKLNRGRSFIGIIDNDRESLTEIS